MLAELLLTILTALPPSGPNGVGRRFEYWTDETRSRDFAVWVWYPAAKPRGSATEPAISESWANPRAEVNRKRFGQEAADRFRGLRVHAITGAKPLNRKFPVLLFSPGYNWIPPEYSSILEDLASHGYLVVGIAPTGFVGPVVFPDGRTERNTYGPPHTSIWEDDLRFALRRLRQLEHADLDRIGIFGHSMGGASSLVVAASEPSVRAALNIDGDPMNNQPRARPTQPLMLLSNEQPIEGESDLELQGAIRSEKRRTNDWTNMSQNAARATRLRFDGTRHLDFTDMTLVPHDLMTAQQRRFRFGPIGGAKALDMTRTAIRKFFDENVLGRVAQ